MCDAADSALRLLEAYLQELSKKTLPTPHQTRILLENVLELQKSGRYALQNFREICPPLSTGKPSQSRYNRERIAIAAMLDEILAKFLAILKNLAE
jgi:hypothetical protein